MVSMNRIASLCAAFLLIVTANAAEAVTRVDIDVSATSSIPGLTGPVRLVGSYTVSDSFFASGGGFDDVNGVELDLAIDMILPGIETISFDETTAGVRNSRFVGGELDRISISGAINGLNGLSILDGPDFDFTTLGGLFIASFVIVPTGGLSSGSFTTTSANFTVTDIVAPVPLPAALPLLAGGLGLLGVLSMRRKRTAAA